MHQDDCQARNHSFGFHCFQILSHLRYVKFLLDNVIFAIRCCDNGTAFLLFSNLKQMLRMHAAALDFDDPLVDGSRRLDL